MKNKEEIGRKFDNWELIWDRSQKLILKVLGGVVGISLAFYVGYDQIIEKSKEVEDRHTVVDQTYQHHIEESSEEHMEEYELIDVVLFVDDYGYRKGDTVYVDYYSDGYIEQYYTDGEDYVDDYN